MARIKIGMVGLDTSHCEVFIKALNYEEGPRSVKGGEVVGAYPGGSKLCAVSRDRVEKFTKTINEDHGVKIYDSMEDLGKDVEAFVLSSVDGRQHLEQFEVLSQFGRPVFMDKPMACSFADAKRIAELAAERDAPVMSASGVRFSNSAKDLLEPDAEVISCEAFGRMPVLEDYPTYFWYGVHAADLLFSHMGKGCKSVQALHGDEIDLLVGLWEGGRTGTVRGARSFQYPFGCAVYSSKGIVQTPIGGGPSAYNPLLEKVIAFLQTGESPVDIEETVEVMAFLEAAGQSLDKGGQPVELPC
ncbi:MAG: Gfo/Idh/MocA family oxidoreductase [Candidatus Brocadiae bacterium]|nr:Gfo/Idh/MocA family oxidoreductase [Candidatus Brocadiia bacterium]